MLNCTEIEIVPVRENNFSGIKSTLKCRMREKIIEPF